MVQKWGTYFSEFFPVPGSRFPVPGSADSWRPYQIKAGCRSHINDKMGSCSSSNEYKRLTPEEHKARRAELISFRNRYAQRAEKVPCNNQRVKFVVEVEPWVAAPEGVRGVDDALASFQRGSHTSTREINMALSGLPSVDNKYDYRKSIVFSLKEKKTGDVLCAALVVEHNFGSNVVFEVIWFVTRRKEEGKKLGTTLFNCIRKLCQLSPGPGGSSGLKAMLITSTPQATGFWLNFLNKVDPNDRFNSPVIRSSKLDSKVENATKQLNDRQKKHLKEGLRLFNVTREPHREMRCLYKSYSGKFKGSPFRYAIDSCTHIWFNLDSPGNKKKPSLSKQRTATKVMKQATPMTSDVEKSRKKLGKIHAK